MLKNHHRLAVWQGDISALAVDAIVNAANPTLIGGAGVDTAVHLAAGPELLAFCRQLHGCAEGQAKLSPGFNLPARAVIHAVGPVWSGGNGGEEKLLGNCYRSVMKIAADEGFCSLAIPAISCGVYGYPLDKAVAIAMRTVDDALDTMPVMQQVIFCCFNNKIAEVYSNHLKH